MLAKVSFLVKILSIDSGKLLELEKLIFLGEYNSHKRMRIEQGEVGGQREGHKLVHIFIDILKIVEIKGVTIKIVPKIFSVLTSLLKNKKTEPIVITATNIS